MCAGGADTVRALLLAAALASGCGWTRTQVALGATSTALLSVDWWQTKSIVNRCLELNPVIGPCGERVHEDVYMMTVIAGNLVVAHLLGRDWREVWLGAMTGAEAATVWSNASIDPTLRPWVLGQPISR
jgi:hypothetical protein